MSNTDFVGIDIHDSAALPLAVPEDSVANGDGARADVGRSPSDRHLQCEGVFNLRDLGGYATTDGRTMRWRTVFRSDGLHRATAGDIALIGLGWRTLIDLRCDAEREGGWFQAEEVELMHLPMLRDLWDSDELDADVADAGSFLADRYLEMAEHGAAAIASTFDLLASPARLPIVFHCSAGKDRTGVLAALVLAAVGIPDDTIAADYQLSALAMDRLVDWIAASQPEHAAHMARQPKIFLECPPHAITAFLDGLRDRHGTVDGYLLDIGVGTETLEKIREVLLEPS